jgi:hypothetical protein
LPAQQITLLVDSNQYLNLFGISAVAKLLGLLDAQKAHLFIPKIIVDEVLRNKLTKSDQFFRNLLKRLNEEAEQVNPPDHLLGIDGAKLSELRNAFADAKRALEAIGNLRDEALLKISQSEDPVSQRLLALFDNPIEPSAEELERAKQRREVGNPPGKPDNPLGDQIIWEQLLTRCRKAERNAVWIISADKDYGVAFGKLLLLNPLLHRELVDVCRGGELELNCFVNLSEGLTKFGLSV